MLDLKKKSVRQKAINFLLRFTSLNIGGVHLKKHNTFETDTSIGTGSRINGGFKAKGKGQLNIGKYCAFGENIRVITSNHNLYAINLQAHLNNQLRVGAADEDNLGVRFGHNVWVGDNVVVLPGVEIGNGAIIGAGAIVTKDVKPFTVNAGNPCREIRARFPNASIWQAIQNVAWWDWTPAQMAQNRKFFALQLNRVTEEEIWQTLGEIQQ